MFTLQTPHLLPIDIDIGACAVIGSGTPAIRRAGRELELEGVLRDQQAFFRQAGVSAAAMTAWSMGNILDSYLRKSGIASVGRVFHTLLLHQGSIFAVPYEMSQPGSTVRIGVRIDPAGRWIQFRSDGAQIELLEPLEVLERAGDLLSEDAVLSLHGEMAA